MFERVLRDFSVSVFAVILLTNTNKWYCISADNSDATKWLLWETCQRVCWKWCCCGFVFVPKCIHWRRHYWFSGHANRRANLQIFIFQGILSCSIVKYQYIFELDSDIFVGILFKPIKITIIIEQNQLSHLLTSVIRSSSKYYNYFFILWAKWVEEGGL